MTLYRAVVKYGVGDSDAQKQRALTEGLRAIYCELIEEHGWTWERAVEELEDAARECELDYQMRP